MGKLAVAVLAALTIQASSLRAAQTATPLEQDMDALSRLVARMLTPATKLYFAKLPAETSVNFKIPLKVNTCYVFLGIGHIGAGDLDMTLHDPANKNIGTDSTKKKSRNVRINHCTNSTGEYRIEMKTSRVGDDVAMRVFVLDPKKNHQVAKAPEPGVPGNTKGGQVWDPLPGGGSIGR